MFDEHNICNKCGKSKSVHIRDIMWEEWDCPEQDDLEELLGEAAKREGEDIDGFLMKRGFRRFKA